MGSATPVLILANSPQLEISVAEGLTGGPFGLKRVRDKRYSGNDTVCGGV